MASTSAATTSCPATRSWPCPRAERRCRPFPSITRPMEKPRPLAGIRVLDFSHAAAAPFATMFLGDMGAEVIKIEKPRQGDAIRSMGVPVPSLGPKDSDYYVSLNRNKKGLVVDLALPEGADLARRLAAQAD